MDIEDVAGKTIYKVKAKSNYNRIMFYENIPYNNLDIGWIAGAPITDRTMGRIVFRRRNLILLDGTIVTLDMGINNSIAITQYLVGLREGNNDILKLWFRFGRKMEGNKKIFIIELATNTKLNRPPTKSLDDERQQHLLKQTIESLLVELKKNNYYSPELKRIEDEYRRRYPNN